MLLVLFLFQWVEKNFAGDRTLARTAALTSTILFQLLLAFSTRSRHLVFLESPFANPLLFFAVLGSFALHLLLIMTPIRGLFLLSTMPGSVWLMVGLTTAAVFALFEVSKILRSALKWV